MQYGNPYMNNPYMQALQYQPLQIQQQPTVQQVGVRVSGRDEAMNRLLMMNPANVLVPGFVSEPLFDIDGRHFMEQEVGKYGNGRMDTKQVGELADVVKDLAEAEYYCTVAQSMTKDSYGYTQSMDRMGYQGGMDRSGYSGSMGHTDPMQVIRDMLATANPEMRAKIRTEIMGM